MNNHYGEKKIKADSYKNANILSKICFWWILPLLYKGFREDITKADINDQIANLKSEELTNKFCIKWHQMIKNGNMSLIKLLMHFYGPSFVISTVLHVILEVLSKIIQVICLGGLTSYFSRNQNNISNADVYAYAAALVISIFLLSLTTNFYVQYVTHIGLSIRLGCSGLVYKKILENKKYIPSFNGRAIQILTNDMRQLIYALSFCNFVILGPAETCALGYLMYREIGYSALCGIFTCLIFLPYQFLSSRFAGKYLQAKSKHTDTRLKLLTEVIQGIQVIKMYTWEKWYYNILINLRKKELKELWGTLKLRAGVNSLRMVSVISIFVSLLSHVYFGSQLSARKVFITSLVFSLINSSMIRFWTISLTSCSEAFISTNRIRDFLIEGFKYKKKTSSEKTKLINEYPDAQDHENLALEMKNKHFDSQEIGINFNNVIVKRKTEQKDEIEQIVLNDINLTINKSNNLIAIVGLVGSGKTTLLNLILGELEIDSGFMEINGKISYAPQQSWIFEGTIQDNILFTEIMDEDRFAKVIKVCALEKDLENLPRKHLTLIGERGINLSGGQKARINLARAIYKEADIYLLDDPFSSVDVEVGQYIYEKCILELLRGKICLLVTHQLKYLENNIKQIIVMKSGRIELQDFFEDLHNSKKSQIFSKLKESENSIKVFIPENKNLSGKKNSGISDDFREEQIETGSIKAVIYQSLMKLIGWWLVGATLLLATISTLSLNGLSYLLRNWVVWEESQINSTNIDYVNNVRHFYELEYLTVVAITLLLNISRFFVVSYVCMKISRNIFITLLRGVMQAYTYFFNTNSSGRIINRFSNDLGLIDGQLSITLQYVIALLTDIPAAAIIVSIINPWLLIPSILVTVPFYLIRKIYIKTSRNMKRIDALSQSPINSHVNETFQGLATIRTFKAEIKMASKFYKYQDFSVSAYFLDSASYRCFTIWIEFFCTLYIAIIAFSFIKYENLFTSGDVGLAIFLCISTVQTLQFAIKFSANFENQLTSVERIIEYANQPTESTLNYPKIHNKEINWPLNGSIEFKSFSLKYGANANNILKNLNFKIISKEKVAIVGRTGGGKSSIVQAIFRLAFNDGKIEIDGVDINTLDLHELRSKISIIPQDPILFSGTIRNNLDPSELLPDDDLWKALDDVELKGEIKNLNQGLECKVLEHGSNFSVGQRQLLCLARAILRNNKILILDEATANVDSLTAALIYKTLQNKFQNSTVITITHRLESITDCDRIMVIDNGNVVEFDTMDNLRNTSNSYFNNLFKKSA